MILRRRPSPAVAALDGTDIAQAVPAAELDTVVKAGTPVLLDAGRVVMDEQTFGREFVLVIAGELDVTRDGCRVARLHAGQFAGEMALLGAQVRNATVGTAEASTVLVYNRREFASVLDTCPAFAAHVTSTAVARSVPV